MIQVSGMLPGRQLNRTPEAFAEFAPTLVEVSKAVIVELHRGDAAIETVGDCTLPFERHPR